MDALRKEVRSILIIDDDRDDFDLVLEAIQEINPAISVSFVSKCEEAAPYKNFPFDLILLDINMPQADGFQWLKSIRKHGRADLPVVMYTNSMSPAHIVRAYESGANLYFSKPETFVKLIKGFRTLLRMDWSNPVLITQQCLQKGRYQTFQYE